MATSKAKDPTIKSDDVDEVKNTDGLAVGGATHAGYEDNPDKPDPTSVAQIQVLSD